MSALYFEDIEISKTLFSKNFLLTQEEIINFSKKWDPQPYHVDPDAAKNHPIGKLFAAGSHLLAICSMLSNSAQPEIQALASMGWDTLRFKHPAFANDQLRCESWAIEKRLSKSRANTGIVTYQLRLLNQDDIELLTYTVTCLVECKPK